MWLSFNSENMTDLELTDYADRYLTDLFSTVDGVGRVQTRWRKRTFFKSLVGPSSFSSEGSYHARS